MKTKYKKCRYKGKRMRLHVAMYLDLRGWDSLPEGYVIHHQDFDPTNNVITNLICIPKSMHDKIHSSSRKRNKYGRFV